MRTRKSSILCTILVMSVYLTSFAQDVPVTSIIPQSTSNSLDSFGFKTGNTTYGGLALTKVNGTIFGNTNSISLYTGGNRDLSFYSGTGNIIFFPNAQNSNTSLRASGKIGIGLIAPVGKLDISGLTYLRNAPTHSIATEQLRFGRLDQNIRYHSIYTNHTGNPETNNLQFRIHNGNNTNFEDQQAVLTLNGLGRVGIGIENPDATLAVNGDIHTKEVKVDLTGWSDFVFEDTYELPTLKEVEDHIKQKGHLKDIPSAKEVEENGILLGEMDARLLQKIEELTLYLIGQNKKLEKLESNNKALQERLLLLEKK
ncbi:hypothetical protein [Spongiimicrobium salis]|uniref:hypothetical protein n=1 Tax=Spongiimicrobium salis TaxID=1667022 RepID=UPI00374D7B09